MRLGDVHLAPVKPGFGVASRNPTDAVQLLDDVVAPLLEADEHLSDVLVPVVDGFDGWAGEGGRRPEATTGGLYGYCAC